MLAPRSSRVVFAEDDATFRNAVLTVLRHWGIEVFACDDGAQAVELCEASKPDAALFDLDMPSMDGFEAARRLRANPALLGMRIVALTGCGSLDYRMRAVDSCFDQFLCKPVSLRPLLEALHLTSHEAPRSRAKRVNNSDSPRG
jgi:DNA-binding response OmpR family regulator